MSDPPLPQIRGVAPVLLVADVVRAAAFPLSREGYRQIPVAAVVLRGAASPKELVAFCKERLGGRAPRWVFVLPSLPKTAGGKVLTRKLAESLSQQWSEVADWRP